VTATPKRSWYRFRFWTMLVAVAVIAALSVSYGYRVLLEKERIRRAADYNDRGSSWNDKGHNDKAIADYTQAIRLNPTLQSAYYNRGISWNEEGDNDKAIADYSEAIRLDPFYADAYANRGKAWVDKGDIDKAIADYNEAISLDPRNALFYSNRGVCWRDKGDDDKAMSDFNAAIRLDPKLALAYSNRGKLWNDKGDFAKANADYTEAVRVDPSDPDPFDRQAWLWATCPNEKYRDGKKAIESATKACEMTGWRAASYIGTLAASYAEAGDFESAVKWAGESLKLAPNSGKKEAQGRLDLYKSGKPDRDVSRRNL
jgi:tetratricopeptide (TPR) repeat protein